MCPTRVMISATIHRADDKSGEIAAEHQTGQTWPEVGGSDTQRDERPKNPLANWMALVAMMSVPICARIPQSLLCDNRRTARRSTWLGCAYDPHSEGNFTEAPH